MAIAVGMKIMAQVLDAMKAAPTGTYVLPADAPRVEVEMPRRVLANPRRIAVMIDGRCGSSCEEFVCWCGRASR